MEFLFNVVVLMGRLLYWLLAQGGKLLLKILKSALRMRVMSDAATGAMQAGAQEAAEADSSRSATQAQPADADRFDPADVIYQVVGFPRGFTARVYVYKKRGEVRRVMSTVDRSLARKMEYAVLSSRIQLSTLSLKDHSMEDILRDTEVKGAEAIQQLMQSIGQVRPYELRGQAEAQGAPIQRQSEAQPVTKPESVPESPATGPVAPDAPGLKVSNRTVRKGEPITGVVLAAAETEAVFVGNGKSPGSKGKTFEVTLGCAAGETSMRGVVLREEFARLAVRPGDRVSITPMGRRKVVDGDQDKGYMKNMFEVELLERAVA